MISNTRRSGYGYDQRIEACGSGGMLVAGNVQADTVLALTEGGTAGAPIQPDFPRRYGEAYRLQLDHFASVLRGQAQPQVGYDDGIAALVLAEACQQSVRSGAPVFL